MLTPAQLEYLSLEGKETDHAPGLDILIATFHQQVDKAISHLRNTDEGTLTDPRGVGRAQIPSTVIGLLTHAAEHTMRHTGQLLVTTKLLRN